MVELFAIVTANRVNCFDFVFTWWTVIWHERDPGRGRDQGLI